MSLDSGSGRPAAQRAVWAVRRILAPAALEMEGQAVKLSEADERLEHELRELREAQRAAEERVAALESQVAELRDGLHEARRLNLRIAELTDLVTELVLPLHDREIDPSVLRSLRPDTL